MSDETRFGIALEKRFTDSPAIAAIDIASDDNLLLYDTSGLVFMRLPFSVLTAALSSAFSGTYATLVDGKVPSSQLPSYVDDVLEYTSSSAFPATGEGGKIYVALDTNKTYRWGGTTYVEISASPGSTDAVPEGATNLYHTTARAAGAAPVQSVAGKTGAVTLSTSDLTQSTDKKLVTDAQLANIVKLGNFANTRNGHNATIPATGLTLTYAATFSSAPALIVTLNNPEFGDEVVLSNQTTSGAVIRVKNVSGANEPNGPSGYVYNHSSIKGWGSILTTLLTDIRQIVIQKSTGLAITYTDTNFYVKLIECSGFSSSDIVSGTTVETFTCSVSDWNALADGADFVLNLTAPKIPVANKYYAVVAYIASTAFGVRQTGDTVGAPYSNFKRGVYTTSGSGASWNNTNPDYGLFVKLLGPAGYVARPGNWVALGN